ncbi:MAG: 3'(2'),5'-bisphosphate nucleotidase CysQ [Flavobacteriales bacterium]
MIPFPDKYVAAIHASIAASKAIMHIYEQDFEEIIKTDGSPLTKADLASSDIIDEHLIPFQIPITGEETEKMHYDERSNWTECWCVDPLDGTKEFIKKNDEFAVNIALIKDGKAHFGLIASPVQQEILIGSKETGVYLFHFDDVHDFSTWKKLEKPKNHNIPLVMACSRSHHSGPVLQFIQSLKQWSEEVSFLKKGSSLKFFDLALGTADVYPRYAPTMEWDIAAGQAILEALGGSVVHAETGEPLRYNKANLTNPYFVARTGAIPSIDE